MGFWRRLFLGEDGTESRTIDTLPWADTVAVPFDMGGPLSPHVSTSRALSLASVFAANRLIAGTLSTVPLKAYRRLGDQRVPMSSLPQLFDQLVTDGQIVQWLHRCVTSLTLRGNAFGLVTERDGYGFPTGITWLNPTDMADDGNVARPNWTWRGRPVPREDVVHIPWFALPDRVQGLSPIASFAATMGVALDARDYGRSWFAAGGFPPGTFRNTERPVVSQDEAQAVKARVTNAIRTRQPLVHGKDWEYSPITVPPSEAQFLETIRATANEVAAIYGVPAQWIGGESPSGLHYSTEEQDTTHLVMFSMRPWSVLLESVFSSLLPDRQYVKFNLDALIRADLRTRHDVYKIDREIGLRSVDELRTLEELPPLPSGGNDYTPLAPTRPAPSSAAAHPNGTNGTPTRQLLEKVW